MQRQNPFVIQPRALTDSQLSEKIIFIIMCAYMQVMTDQLLNMCSVHIITESI